MLECDSYVAEIHAHDFVIKKQCYLGWALYIYVQKHESIQLEIFFLQREGHLIFTEFGITTENIETVRIEGRQDYYHTWNFLHVKTTRTLDDQLCKLTEVA